jgi:hypothetical protein
LSTQSRLKGELPLGGLARSAKGVELSTQSRLKGELPLGGLARSAKGVELTTQSRLQGEFRGKARSAKKVQ